MGKLFLLMVAAVIAFVVKGSLIWFGVSIFGGSFTLSEWSENMRVGAGLIFAAALVFPSVWDGDR